MKSLKFILFILSFMVIGISNTINTSADVNQPSTLQDVFPDKNLAEVMRRALGKEDINSSITQEELNTITSLDGDSSNIGNLEGLEHLKNITKLHLSGNTFSDLTPISELINLRELQVGSNENLVSIEPLSTLVNLEEFWGSYTKITDLTPISNLVSLKTLTLFNTNVTDITMLNKLINLETLHVVAIRGPKDISSLKYLPNLKTLNLRYSRVLDLSVFNSGFNSLTSLQLTNINDECGKLRVDENNIPINDISNEGISFDGTPLIPSSISDNGVFDSDKNTISWSALTPDDTVVLYEYDEDFVINGKTVRFQATVEVPVLRPSSLVFNSLGGTTYSDKNIYIGDTIGELPIPNREGAIFKGWFYDSTYEEVASPEDIVSGDTTIYAKWDIITENEYTVSFDTSGGSKVGNQTIISGAKVMKPEKPEKAGYTFIEWQLNGEKYDFNQPVTSDITLVAVYEKNIPLNVEPKSEKNDSLPTTGEKKTGITFLGATILFLLSTLFRFNRRKHTSK